MRRLIFLFIFSPCLAVAQSFLPTVQESDEVTVSGAPSNTAAIYFVDASPGSRTLDLSTIFKMEPIDDQVVRFTTSLIDPETNAPFFYDVALFSSATPGHRQNFLNYVTSDRYRNSVVHRSVLNFVIQGGGFAWNDEGTALDLIPTDEPVQNEFGISNTQGTVSLAKSPGNPSSGTSQWFVSLSDNVTNLDPQNGGFTVFGRVTASTFPNVLKLADFSQFPTSNLTQLSESSEFRMAVATQVLPALTNMPFAGVSFAADSSPTLQEGFDASVRFTSVERVDLPNGEAASDEGMVFEVIQNSNPSVVSTNLDGAELTFTTASSTGDSVVRIRATDSIGNVVEKSITVRATTQVGYNTWLAQNFTAIQVEDESITGPTADENGDGVPNMFHYLFALPTDTPQVSPIDHLFDQVGSGVGLRVRVPFSNTARNPVLNVEGNLGLLAEGWVGLQWTGPLVIQEDIDPGRSLIEFAVAGSFPQDRLFFRTVWGVSNR